MIPESLRNIATQIEEAAKVRTNSQEAILAFCKDKSFDLDERFAYWEKYCNKNENCWIMRKKDVKSNFLGFLIEKANNYYERRDNVDYDTLIDMLENITKDDFDVIPEIKRELIIDSVLEDKSLDFSPDSNDWETIMDKMTIILKENILQENFGLYTIDW